MSGMMSVALPVVALGAAAFTGGSSLGLLGGGAGFDAADTAFLGAADTSAGVSPLAVAASNAFTYATTNPGTILAMGASAGGTALSAMGAKQSGDAAQQEADFEAKQLNQNADEKQAAAEQQGEQQNKATAYAMSNAQAAAAAGGGSATDPTVTNIMQTIAGQGRYRALTDMYNGNAAAQADRTAAAAKQYGGALASQAGDTKMFSTILGGASSLYDKYGNPSSSNNNGTLPPWANQ